MAKKIYVGNLAYAVENEDLTQYFSPMGEVLSARVVKDPATGRSKGFGFVEMANDEEADKAIAELNGTMLMNRPVVVSEAKPQREGGARRGPGGGRPAGRGAGGRGGFGGRGGGTRPGGSWNR